MRDRCFHELVIPFADVLRGNVDALDHVGGGRAACALFSGGEDVVAVEDVNLPGSVDVIDGAGEGAVPGVELLFGTVSIRLGLHDEDVGAVGVAAAEFGLEIIPSDVGAPVCGGGAGREGEGDDAGWEGEEFGEVAGKPSHSYFEYFRNEKPPSKILDQAA